MTSLLINITDDSKANDVMRFLDDIPFLEVIPQGDAPTSNTTKPFPVPLDIKNNNGLDFSKYKVDSFLGCDPLKYQKSMRDEWK